MYDNDGVGIGNREKRSSTDSEGRRLSTLKIGSQKGVGSKLVLSLRLSNTRDPCCESVTTNLDLRFLRSKERQ